MVFERLARFKVAFSTLSMAILAKEKRFAEVAGYMHQEFWTSCWIARYYGLAGSEKWASTSPYWITSSGLASGVSRQELPFELNYKCRN